MYHIRQWLARCVGKDEHFIGRAQSDTSAYIFYPDLKVGAIKILCELDHNGYVQMTALLYVRDVESVEAKCCVALTLRSASKS